MLHFIGEVGISQAFHKQSQLLTSKVSSFYSRPGPDDGALKPLAM